MTTKTNKEWLECKCTVPEHSIRVTLDKGDPLEDPEIYLQPVWSEDASFWTRLKLGLKYIFFGHSHILNETILDSDSIVKLSRLLSTYRVLVKLRKAKRAKLKAKGLNIDT